MRPGAPPSRPAGGRGGRSPGVSAGRGAEEMATTFQFAIGVFLYGEPLPPVRLVGFVLVWAALAVFTVEVLEHRRRQIRLALQAAAT